MTDHKIDPIKKAAYIVHDIAGAKNTEHMPVIESLCPVCGKKFTGFSCPICGWPLENDNVTP